MNLNCAKCGVGLEVDDDVMGQIETCPSCSTMFEVPMIARDETAPGPVIPPGFEPLAPAPPRLELKQNPVIKGGAETQSRRGSSGNVVAALASFAVPGLGQLAQARLIGALAFLLAAIMAALAGAIVALYLGALIAIGIIGIWAAADAALWTGGNRQPQTLKRSIRLCAWFICSGLFIFTEIQILRVRVLDTSRFESMVGNNQTTLDRLHRFVEARR